MNEINKVRGDLLGEHSPVREVFAPPIEVMSAMDQALFDDNGHLRVLPAAELAALDPEHLRFWLHVRAIYLLPSAELVAWLKDQIGDRSAIEIASGNGALGRALGIPMTDNRMQEWTEIRVQMLLMGQPTVFYGKDVQNRNANAAVRLTKPEVTIASWATHIYEEDDHARGGNMWGIDERKIVAACDYIHIGSVPVHKKKRIMALPHEEHELPGLIFGRAKPEDRRVWIWRKA